ncbi:MAG: Panacea domain-containing protein [Gemmatimonadales bacterium]
MVRLNYGKLEQLILYVAQQYQDDPNFGLTWLAKILFWSDFRRYRQAGEAITGIHYIKMPNGPMPEGLDEILQSLQGKGALRVESRKHGDYTQRRAVPIREPDMQLFSADEVRLIDQVIAENRGRSARDVSALSHEFLGWQVAARGERIPYGTAFLSAPTVTAEDVRIASQLESRLGRR